MSKSVIQIEGFDELNAKIKKLSSTRNKRKQVLGILRNAARTTVKAARSFTPVSKKPHVARGKVIQPGTLKKSIGTITGRKGSAKINPTIYVGPRAKGRYNGYYGAWVHEGVNIYRSGFKRKRKKGANNKAALRRTKGNPFMDKAYKTTKGRVSAEMEKNTARYIQRRINKLSN